MAVIVRFLLIVSCLAILGQALTPSSYFSADESQRIRKVFDNTISAIKTSKLADLTSAHFAVLGTKLLDELEKVKTSSLTKNSQDLCSFFENIINTKGSLNTLSQIYYATAASNALSCKNSKPGADLKKSIETARTSGDSSAIDLYYAALSSVAIGEKVDAANILKSLQSALKKDEGLVNLGHAFQLASQLETAAKDNSAIENLFDKVEDAIVQADEVDGKNLQFEGGLGVTNMILSGAYGLGEKLNKAPALSKMQAVKFANYFLSRKSVQSAKGAYHLVEALISLSSAKNKFHVPVAITLVDGNVVDEKKKDVVIRITDIVGNDFGQMNVNIESAMRQNDGAVIMAKTKMNPVKGQANHYSMDMMSSKPGRGFYELTITATPNKADERLVGNTGAILLVKTLAQVKIGQSEIGVVDADQSTAPKLTSVDHPKKLAKKIEADQHHKIVFKFAIQDQKSQEKIRAHQTFVMFTHVDSGSEIVFVAEPDSNNVYKFDLDLSAKSKDFGGKSGLYKVNLIVGDSVVSNPIDWHVADVALTLPSSGKTSDSSENYGFKPEIKHMFREPETRPPSAVSNLFTVLCIAPFLIMIIWWMRVGVNVSNFSFSVSAFGFHLGLGAIFSLYYYFWLQLDMFTTVKYLFMVGVVTFLCGNSLLVKIAAKRK